MLLSVEREEAIEGAGDEDGGCHGLLVVVKTARWGGGAKPWPPALLDTLLGLRGRASACVSLSPSASSPATAGATLAAEVGNGLLSVRVSSPEASMASSLLDSASGVLTSSSTSLTDKWGTATDRSS